MVSVTIEAFPSRRAANRSPSGTMAMRCCHGRYRGVKCFSMSKPSGSSGRIDSMRNVCSSSGASSDVRASQWYCEMYWRRRISCVHSSGMSSWRSVTASSWVIGGAK